MMVTHFSFGSFFSLHGCSTSPFFTRLLWKNRDGPTLLRSAEEPPKEDAGRELYCESNGFPPGPAGTGVMPSSPNGFILLSGVPGRIGVVAAETCEASLPL